VTSESAHAHSRPSVARHTPRAPGRPPRRGAAPCCLGISRGSWILAFVLSSATFYLTQPLFSGTKIWYKMMIKFNLNLKFHSGPFLGIGLVFKNQLLFCKA
jgi:hypothetical protein